MATDTTAAWHSTVTELEQTYAVLRHRHGATQATLDLQAILGHRDRAWLAACLAAAVADLDAVGNGLKIT